MRKILLPISLVAMIWSACSKPEIPGGGFDSPVFWVGIEVDSPTTSIGMTAGVDGTYLFTGVERGLDEVLVMSGSFADAGCPMGDCPGSVKFEFRNVEQGNIVEPNFIFGANQSWEYKSPLSDTLALASVAIRWVQPNGNVLRSDLLEQPKDSSGVSLSQFSILTSEPWELNERGEMTWKMSVNFSCFMLDSMQVTETKVIGSGVIAVGYR